MCQEDLLAHYQTIADSLDIPFVLYNIPQFSNPLSASTMLKIVETCGPVALKNSSPSVIEMMTLLNALKGTMVSYLVGPDELLFTGLELGAAGSMSGLTGAVPEGVRAMIDAYRAGEIAFARKIQFAFLELLRGGSEGIRQWNALRSEALTRAGHFRRPCRRSLPERRKELNREGRQLRGRSRPY